MVVPRYSYGRNLGVTQLPCDKCGKPVSVQRSCFEVWLHCESCGSNFPLENYVARMDETLERCLESVYCDRM